MTNQPLLDTILTHLTLLFLTAAGDPEKARQAATQALDAYHAQSEEELRLAAEIISFGFHSLQALAEAADPAISLTRKIRLRGSAVSLSRQAHKAQCKLDQLQRPKPQPATSKPAPPKATDAAVQNAEPAKPATGRPWTQDDRKRALTARMNETIRQQQARRAATAPPA